MNDNLIKQCEKDLNEIDYTMTENLKPKDILFEITHSTNAGFIAVVFTPEMSWLINNEIAKLYEYIDIQKVIEELQLIQVLPSVFEHQGLNDEKELTEFLLLVGFIQNTDFSEHVLNNESITSIDLLTPAEMSELDTM